LKRYNYAKSKITTIHELLEVVPVMGANPSTLGNLNPQERDEEKMDYPARVTLPRECFYLAPSVIFTIVYTGSLYRCGQFFQSKNA
jgi:hypothetical protein